MVAWLLAPVGVGPARGAALAPIRPAQQAMDAPRRLQLEIFVNGEDLGLVEGFTFDPIANRLFARRADLEQAGVRTPPGGRDQMVCLGALGLIYRYDEANQRIDFTLSDAQRLPKTYDADPARERLQPRADLGALFNYSLFAGSSRDFRTGDLLFSGANAQLDARVFSNYGLIEQSGVVGSTVYGDGRDLLRLDTTFTYSDPDSAITYHAGDVISGGTAWTRPIRLAGAQAARDFALRSDIVTRPLPQISGTAAAPSTVDVLVNGARAYSQQVGAGPYSIVNIPVMTAGGDAQVVIRDSTGRTIEQNLTLFDTTKLLAPALTDFSAEVGLARRNFGVLSMDYDRRPIGSGTLRYGALRWLTLETHAEAGAGLANVGAGAVAGLGRFGAANLAVSGSRSNNGAGAQAYLDWQMTWLPFSLSLGAQRTLGAYDDLASATAAVDPVAPAPVFGGYSPFAAPAATLAALADLRPPRELDRAAIGFPLFDHETSINLGAVNLVQQDRTTSRLLVGSLSRPLWSSQSRLYVSAFADIDDRRSLGLFAGVSLTFDNGIAASLGASYDASSGGAATTDIGKSQQPVDGASGWRLRTSAGAINALQADGSYRSSVGQVSASVLQTKAATSGTAQLDGSIAWIGGAVVPGNRVDSSFALVDAGAPGVTVMQDNHPLGKTGASGKYLVPDLRGFEPNQIGIDPSGMPVNYDAAKVNEVVAPRDRSGVYLKFGDDARVEAAIVVFVDAGGKPLAVGARGHLEGGAETFLVGHDGRAYVRGLAAANVAVIDAGEADCRASFAFAPVAGRQVVVRGVVCR